jgi:ammonium transporter, Amt family
MHSIDPAATAWLLASIALVLPMTPGLAIFYGGMVRTTGVLNMMMSFISIPLVTVAWLLVGYTIAFSQDGAGGLVGNLRHFGMLGITPETAHGAVPELLYATFQLMFAIITAALVSGAIADRAKFAAWMAFVPAWTIVVYSVVAHWVWGPVAGWASWGCSTIRAASSSRSCPVAPPWRWRWCSGPASASRRTPCGRTICRCSSSVSGCCGSAGSGSTPVLPWPPTEPPRPSSSTRSSPAAWACSAGSRSNRSATFGAASGVVAGLVAITPSCGTVNTLGAAVVGLAAGIVCSFAVGAKFRFNYDDSLDVAGVHFVGGVVGVSLIGLLATAVMTSGPRGLFYGGGFTQLGKQALAIVVVALYAFTVSFVLAKLIDRMIGFRLSPEDETTGIDLSQHAETAYAEGVHGHLP